MRALRLSTEDKRTREKTIGKNLFCPVCEKKTLNTWESERYLKCTACGANWQRKVRFIKKRRKKGSDTK